MKSIFHLLSAIFLLSSCQNSVVPVVVNRDAQGRYIVPVCPKDGLSPVASGSLYVCPSGHPFVSWNVGQQAAAPKLKL
jgi:hypothetical protein